MSEIKKQNSLLQAGNTVGLIAPAGFITKGKLNSAVKNLKSLGLNAEWNNEITVKTGYLAGGDLRRLKELHQMYENKHVKAVLCVRGGYGTTRIIDKIDYKLIKNNPKPLIGYSDITALINGIYKKTGIPGFHGIVGASNFTSYTFGNFKSIFFSDSEDISISIFSEHKKDAYIINSGDISGKLAGGNLSLIINSIGTPFEVSWKNKIIFLEDLGEAPYKIDRMLTHLISAGKFKGVQGVIFGKFSGCEPNDSDKESSFSLKEVIFDRIKPLNIPAVYGFSFGHIENQAIFPVGVNARFDTKSFTIKIKRKEINKFFN